MSLFSSRTALALLFFTLCLSLPGQCRPEEVEDGRLWQELESELRAGMKDGQFTGATILVGQGERVLYYQAVGTADVTTSEAMTKEHLFDSASLTKPLVTAVSVLLLVQDGKLSLDAPVTDYLPGSVTPSPTIRQLLTHHAGLPPVVDAERLEHLATVTPPGTEFVYSDVGFILLARVVEKVSGLSLDRFYARRVAEPLEIPTACFRPRTGPIVPTYGVEKGVVHDPRARALGGVAGHAGLFATAMDVHLELARLNRVLRPEYVYLLFKPSLGGRTLGLDQETSFSTARGERFSPLTSAGHTGFTGTSFWWDEPSGIHVVLMTSRLHPDNEGDVKETRSRVATLVAEHFLGKQVKTGLDQLWESDWGALAGKKVGFVVNQTSRDRFGRHVVDLLSERRNFELTCLFTPEHGITGQRDEEIEDGFHQELNIPIYSLFGETRKPRLEWFEGLDVVVFDLQDVGVRYYTYISTLQAVLETARATGVKILVLDRPNPLGGEIVDGSVAETFSFIACDALPMVHGMTIGEVAGFLNRDIKAELSVIKMTGWSRAMTWQQTGLAMIAPSPNLAELESVLLYPVLGQLEWCELSVGRGTRAPFRTIGAPYIKDPSALAAMLNREFAEDLEFRPRIFVPSESKFEGLACGGVEITARRPLLRPADLGRRLGLALEACYPDHFHLEGAASHYGLEKGRRPTEGTGVRWRNERQKYLLYPEGDEISL